MKALIKIKRGILLIFFCMVCSNLFFSQSNVRDIFCTNNLVWYGLDFSEAKFIGRFDQGYGIRSVNESEIVNKYIPAWNELIVIEPWNFQLKSTFRKTSIYYDLEPVAKRNASIKTEGLFSYNTHFLPKDHLDKMIASYEGGDKNEGLGLVFIVESFDKPNRTANFWIVFFDIKTKSVLLSEYCSGEPVGFGIRNYWAGAIKHVLRDIRYVKFNRWNKVALKKSENVVQK